MVSEWPEMTLEKANVVLIDCVHKTPPKARSGLPYLAIPQMTTGTIDLSDARLIEQKHFEEWTQKANPQPHDVVLSRRCNPGVTAAVPEGVQFALGQNLVLLRADDTRVAKPFLKWLVRSPVWWEQVEKFINVGAVFDSLRCADVPKFELPIPPLSEQRRIAHILGALDDKIELNRRMSQTLEKIAQAVFKSWFIDFDGQGDLVESELGMIPRGWEVRPIQEVVTTVGGGTPSTKNPTFWDRGSVNWATPKDLSDINSPALIDTARTITQAGLAKISSGLLPRGTLLLSSRAPVGYLAIADIPLAVNQGFIAMLPGGRLSPLYLLHWAQANMDRIKARAGGTTFAEISKRSFRPMPVVVPTDTSVVRFESVAGPAFSRITLGERESRTLASLRDTLLPKLISGVIRIRDAEEAVEAVV